MRWGNDSLLRRLMQAFTGVRRPRRWGSGSSIRLPAWRRAPRVKRVKWHSSSAARPIVSGAGSALESRNFAGWKQQVPKRKRKRRLWLITLLIFILLSVQMFIYVDRHLREPLMHLAKIRMKQMATQAINKAISEQITNGRSMDQLIQWNKDNQGKVSSFILNSNEHMRITSETVTVVQDALHAMEEFKDHIPLGQVLGSAIIASFGPRIPIKMEPQGAVKVELSTRARDVAINMVLVEVYVKVVEEVAIVIPFDSQPEIVETEIPISYLLVVGDVPMYYYDGAGNPVGTNRDQAPAISLPPLSKDKGTTQNNPGVSVAPQGETPVIKPEGTTGESNPVGESEQEHSP
ncbi:sporulation protein YunB [Paenibacillus marinisediminis]